jgi:hypothetical protein
MLLQDNFANFTLRIKHVVFVVYFEITFQLLELYLEHSLLILKLLNTREKVS